MVVLLYYIVLLMILVYFMPSDKVKIHWQIRKWRSFRKIIAYSWPTDLPFQNTVSVLTQMNTTTDIHQEWHSQRRDFIVSTWVHHSLVQCRTLFLPLLAPLFVHTPGMITSLLGGTVRARYSWLHCME